ncbi:hypothetical protein GGX14DRAFT_569903 [Mycena pura]|uniref:Uncharacterized protein n=1 Tax=Mycena pura TaxID=153505 RepID=A0AAD6YDF8_9AGAR|nr:hypothetical protein GGX14DRAFT_569903 [Mycena pura]
MESPPGLQTRSRKRKRNPEVEQIGIDIQEIVEKTPGAEKWFQGPRKPAKKPRAPKPRPKSKAKNTAPKPRKKVVPARVRSLSPHVPVAGPSNSNDIEISSDSDDDYLFGFHSLLSPRSQHHKPATFHFKADSLSYHKSVTPSPETAQTYEDEERARECTVYVYVSKPGAAAPIRGKAPPPVVAERGPFFFPLNATFSMFCGHLSTAAGCRVAALNLPFVQWNTVISVKERKKDLTIEIHMPPPLLLAADLPYETDDYKPPDSFEELDAPVPSSVHQQMATLDVAAAPVMEQLREQYPVGNHPAFANKRIFTDPKFPDRHWELSDIRIRVWAAHILQGKASLTAQPKSAHFSEDQRIRQPRDTTRAPTVPAIAVAQPLPTPATPAATSPTDLILLMLAQQFSANNRNLAPIPIPATPVTVPYPATPVTAPTTPTRAIRQSIPAASPTVALPRDVSVHEFCERYSISALDESRLLDLEFAPGDRNIVHLGKEDWGEVGFKRLSWLRILDAHKQFLMDIRTGDFL